jgi:hypothetical protein
VQIEMHVAPRVEGDPADESEHSSSVQPATPRLICGT